MRLTEFIPGQLSAFPLVVGGWFLSIALGSLYLVMYSFSSGEVIPPTVIEARATARALRVSTSPDSHHLIMAVHPRCPCSSSSISELKELLNKCGNNLTCTILAFSPNEESAAWIDSKNIEYARLLPRTLIVLDTDGKKAESLGMKTSGAVVLLSASGEPLFYGGITQSRGHHGDNVGSEAICEIIQDGFSQTASTPVYGCPISVSEGTCPTSDSQETL